MSLSREASFSHQGLLLNLRVTCEQVWSDCGQGTGMGPRASVRGMGSFEGDANCLQ